MSHWIKIAESVAAIAFGANNLAEITAGEKTICVGRHAGKLFAFAQKCPHASGALVQGWIDGVGNVVCPLHRYKFCMANGRNVSGEGYKLRHWPIEEREDGVWVQLAGQSIFDLL